MKSKNEALISYTNGFFLGRHELKFELLNELKSKMLKENTIENGTVTVRFYGKNEQPNIPTINFLPILIHSCPDDFSTVDYFDVCLLY